MLAFGRIINLEDHIVMEKLQESSAWKDEAKNLSKGLVDLKKMCVLYPLAEGKIDEVETKIEEVTENVQKSIEQLKAEDSKRKLYTFSKSQAKSSVPYPVFKSNDEEDVHKFIKETKELFVRNRVSAVDQARILRSNLKGFALDIIHKDIIDIEVAYTLLIRQYGGTDRVWSAKYKLFVKECEGKWPGLQNAKQRYQKASKILAQLEELEKLISEGSADKAEMYNAVSVKKLFSLMPSEVVNDTLEGLKIDTNSEEKVKNLKKILIKFQKIAQNKMLLLGNDKESEGGPPRVTSFTMSILQGTSVFSVRKIGWLIPILRNTEFLDAQTY